MARQVEGPWYRASKGSWYATIGGKSVSLSVKGKSNRKAASAAWHKLMAGCPRPERVATEPGPKSDGMTVQGMVDAFLADAQSRLKPTTVRIYREYLRRFATTLGSEPVSELHPKDIHRWMLTTGKTGTTHGIALRSISACLGWAVKNDLLDANPAKKVNKPKSRSRSAEAVISDGDHAKLIGAATKEFRVVLQVLHATGCRPGEACKISGETFDPVNGVVKLIDHKSDKTGRPRVIFLPPAACELLKLQAARFEAGPLLRSNKGTPWTGRSITQAMRRLKKKAGVTSIAYGYRHGFCTTALSRGVPDAHVADAPTHADAVAAAGLLFDAVCDFPFERPEHRAAWLAGLLSPLAWFAFDGPAPFFLIDGNVRGVGKGLLADAVALPVLGRRFSAMTYTPDRDELRKRITSVAAEGERMVLLDNLSGAIGNDQLDAALTADRWKDRLLGGNRVFDGPLATITTIATGREW